MNKVETFTAVLPAHWASYLFDGDASSFDLGDPGNEEVARIDKWCEANPGICVYCDEESEFRYGSSDCPDELAGEYMTFTFMVLEGEA